MDIKISVNNADKEIKLLEKASSLIEELQSVLRELDLSINDCKAFAESYSSDKD